MPKVTVTNRRSFISTILACGVVGISESSRANMKAICSEDQHLSSNIPIGKSLRDVVVILDSYRVQYMIFSKDMRISMRAASEGNFKLISPVSIVVQPAVKSLYGAKAKGLIQRDELLTLTFDIEGRLESKTCKTIFTGP